MPSRRRTLATGIALIVGVAAAATAGWPGTALADASLADLKRGGYVIFIRHTVTDWQTADRDVVDLKNCATQRSLSQKGREDARAIGAAIKRLGIPVGRVAASPYCRAIETARLAFGTADVDEGLAQLAGKPTEADWRPVFATLKARLATRPAPGSNTVLVGHGTNLLGAAQVKVEEGQAAIFEPQSDGTFRLVGRIALGDWGKLGV
jgi:phosphohistidine phosphatase SixA